MIGLDRELETTPFRVLIVSSGDVSRGPAAHRLLRNQLRSRKLEQSVVLSSAGVDATIGQPMLDHTIRALSELKVDAHDHESHRISERRLAQADLVLAATRAQVSSLLDLRDDLRERAFTILEFARLAAALDPLPVQPSGLVAAVADARASVRALAAAEDDVDAPAASFRDHERMTKRVDHATRDLSRALAACLRSPMSGVA